MRAREENDAKRAEGSQSKREREGGAERPHIHTAASLFFFF